MVLALIRSLRPKQWTKNLLVFAGYLFTIGQHHEAGSLLRVCAAFGLFCAISGAGYIFNDILDAEHDRKHPTKCHRPIASGDLPIPLAIPFAVILVAGSIAAAFMMDIRFGSILAAYFVLTVTYSLALKHIVILDLLAIAAGFVIRAVAGAFVIDVKISPWLLVCTTLLALFLGLAKRRSELVALQNGGGEHRKTLTEYSAPMLEQMLGITASATLMSYCLYTFTGETGRAHPNMMATIPFVIYGLFRYLYLVHNRNAGGSPELVLLEDKPMLVNMLLYVVVAVFAIKF